MEIPQLETAFLDELTRKGICCISGQPLNVDTYRLVIKSDNRHWVADVDKGALDRGERISCIEIEYTDENNWTIKW